MKEPSNAINKTRHIKKQAPNKMAKATSIYDVNTEYNGKAPNIQGNEPNLPHLLQRGVWLLVVLE